MTMTTTPTPKHTIIRFTLVNRRARTTQPCWLASVSYADGPGNKVKKMTTTRDRSKAARFSLVTAHDIAAQFHNYPAALERPDGTPMPEETALLQVEVTKRRDVHRAAVTAVNAEVAAINAEIINIFRTVTGR